MRVTIRGFAVVFALLLCTGIAWAQAEPPAPGESDEALATPASEAVAPAGGSAEAPLLIGFESPTEAYFCGNEFTCRQQCKDDCKFNFDACTAGCGNPSCMSDCFFWYQECVAWCDITF